MTEQQALLTLFWPSGLVLGVFAGVWWGSKWLDRRIPLVEARWNRVIASDGRTGCDVARALLDQAGLLQVPIRRHADRDLYRGAEKAIYLRNAVYQGRSILSLSVGAHEVGHAIQHATDYLPYRPWFQRASEIVVWISYILSPFTLLSGLLLRLQVLVGAAVCCALVAWVIPAILTLAKELDASRRAAHLLDTQGVLSSEEQVGTREYYRWAAATYVADLVVSQALFPAGIWYGAVMIPVLLKWVGLLI